MLAKFSKMQTLLSHQEKVQLSFLAVLVSLAALFETLGIASILPYMSLLTVPDADASKRIFSYAAMVFGTDDRGQLVTYVGIVVFVAIVSGTILSGLSAWLLFGCGGIVFLVMVGV